MQELDELILCAITVGWDFPNLRDASFVHTTSIVDFARWGRNDRVLIAPSGLDEVISRTPSQNQEYKNRKAETDEDSFPKLSFHAVQRGGLLPFTRWELEADLALFVHHEICGERFARLRDELVQHVALALSENLLCLLWFDGLF